VAYQRVADVCSVKRFELDEAIGREPIDKPTSPRDHHPIVNTYLVPDTFATWHLDVTAFLGCVGKIKFSAQKFLTPREYKRRTPVSKIL
jgi:hypothetical protein